ncbi:hypothetical protein Tco_0328173 [Tanacetum coccineum]
MAQAIPWLNDEWLNVVVCSTIFVKNEMFARDNASTSNPQEPKHKWFPNSTSFLERLSRYVYGIILGNDHVAATMGFSDPQWENILITRVYYVEGLGHNMFSMRQFCDADLENDREDLGKVGSKGDIGFFIGYDANARAYKVYNRRTKKVMEMMNITFDELSKMEFEQRRLVLNNAPSTIPTHKPTERELGNMFKTMYDDYMGGQLSDATRIALAGTETLNRQTPNASTTVEEDAPTQTNSSTKASVILTTSQDVDEQP